MPNCNSTLLLVHHNAPPPLCDTCTKGVREGCAVRLGPDGKHSDGTRSEERDGAAQLTADRAAVDVAGDAAGDVDLCAWDAAKD